MSTERKYKILIVDDEQSTLMILEKYLEKQGFKVKTSQSVSQAIELLKQEKMDFVITDLNMPDVTGFEFLVWLKKYSPKTLISTMSAYSDPELIDFVNKNGAIKFFPKPLKFEEVSSFLKEKLDNNGFVGSVNEVGLVDILQVILISDRSTIISIKNPPVPGHNQVTGLIYVNEGEVVHAEYSGLQGNQALYKMLGLRNGIFNELPWTNTGKRTITEKVQELLGKYDKNLSKEIKILVVDDDVITTLITEKFLRESGYTVTISNSAIEAAQILREDFYDLVITDVNMPDVNGLEFILWVNENSPTSQVIIISSLDSEELQKFASQKGVVKLFQKPPNFSEINELIKKQFESTGFTGSVSYIDLSEFLNITVFSHTNKLIKITDPSTRQESVLYIKNGAVVHAEFGTLTGEEAFFSIIEIKNGLFIDLPWTEPERETISISYAELLKKSQNNLSEISKNVDDLYSQNKREDIKQMLSLVRKKDNEFDKVNSQAIALSKIRTDSEYRYTIFENGVALGVVINNSTRAEVIENMRDYSVENHYADFSSRMIIYNDVGVTFLFNDHDILEEMRFEGEYKGKTSRGLMVGDSVMKAIELYGQPNISTIKGAVWDNLAIFYQTGMAINTIKIRQNTLFSVKKPVTPVIEKKVEEEKAETETDYSVLNEEKGIIFGLKINQANKENIIEKLREITHSQPSFPEDRVIAYDNLGVTFYLGEKEILKEIIVKTPFQGRTLSGISINDPTSKALTHYGKPKISSSSGALWNNIFMTFEEGLIKSIRLKF